MRFLASLLIVSCLGTSFAHAETTPTYQTRVVWGACDHATKDEDNKARFALLGAVLMAVAPKLIEGAVDSAANALKAAGESKSVSSSAKNLDYFYKVNDKGDLLLNSACVKIVRGEFGKPSDQRIGLAAIKGFEGWKSSIVEFEAQVEPLKGLKFMRLRPVYLKVAKFEESTWFSGAEREYTIAVTLTVPGGEKPFGTASFSFEGVHEADEWQAGDWRFANQVSDPISLAPESADATKTRTELQGKAAPYLLAMDIIEPTASPQKNPMPSVYKSREVIVAARNYCAALRQQNALVPDAVKVQDDRCKYELEEPAANLELALKNAQVDPVRFAWAKSVCGNIVQAVTGIPDVKDPKEAHCENFKGSDTQLEVTYFSTGATLVETRAGSKFAKFLGTALGAAKSDVSAEISKRILPKTQAQSDADDQANRDARRGVTLNDMLVAQAEDTLADAVLAAKPADVTAARIALVKAKIAANDAYRKNNLPVPYPELD